ncbi:chorismate mutase [Pseudoxanthomonas sp. NC8]|nr:chorismate mutase [Pseudoxanthomonas sp. NC8]
MHTPRGLPPSSAARNRAARRIAAGTLAGARHAIDRVDDAVVALTGLRRQLVGAVHRSKRMAGMPVRDGEREAGVLSRARRVAARVAVPDDTADALMRVLMSDACRQQVLVGDAGPPFPSAMPLFPTSSVPLARGHRLLRLLPPPRRLQPLLRRLPRAVHAPWPSACWRVRCGGSIRTRSISCAAAGSASRCRIWALRRCSPGTDSGCVPATGRQNPPCAAAPPTCSAWPAAREDADTLFFQRRLVLTGDVELGLTVRNLLDRLPWEDLPLGLRIVLHRGCRLLRAARDAHAGRPS